MPQQVPGDWQTEQARHSPGIAAATPGPWEMTNEPEGSGFFGTKHGKGGVSFSGSRADNEFIAHAPEDIAYLLDENDRLTADRDKQKKRAEAAERRFEECAIRVKF